MSIVLRPRQVTFKADCREALRNVRSVLGVAPCGFGKGVIEADMVNSALDRGKYVLFIVRGRDRVFDMDQRVTAIGVPHGVLMGGEKRERWHKAQVASSDTVARMAHKPRADFILVDEAHLGCSPTFRSVLDAYPEAKVLGFTATPMLGSGRALGKDSGGIFDAMVKGPSVKELINEGFLVRSRVFNPPSPEKLQGLKKKKTGEFDENEGAAICDTTKIIGDIIENWKTIVAYQRKTISFGFNQAHAFHIAEKFRESGINWAYVDADTPEGDIHTPGTRKFIWHQYDHGDLVGISSCRITEIGWDHSVCKAVIFGSKIGSFPTYHQRLGRAGRGHKGFSDFFCLDHCDNVGEHESRGPFFESDIDWQLDGDPVKPTDSAQRVSQCKRPVAVPDSGVPSWFHGELSRDRKYMLCCYFTFSPGPDRCPRCGIPIETQERKIEVEEGELKELTEEDRERMEAEIRATSERKAFYLDLVKLQVAKNYKSGYAPLVFKSKHGYWPPKGWKAEIDKIIGTAPVVAPDESEVFA